MERCPVCRARYRDEPVCRRCRTDLVSLHRIAARAEQLASLAVREIAAGDYRQAGAHIRKARFLHATPFINHLSGFLESCLEDL